MDTFFASSGCPLTRPSFKVALSPMNTIFKNFAKSRILSCLLKFDNAIDTPLKLQSRMFLASYTVAMVTYCVTKMKMIGQFFFGQQ